MQILAIIVGIIVGVWVARFDETFLGVVLGGLAGWLVYRQNQSREDLRALREHIALLEMKSRSIRVDADEQQESPRAAARSKPAPERVSIYEPEPKPEPVQPAASTEPPEVATAPEEPIPVTPSQEPAMPQATAAAREPSTMEHLIDVAKRWITTGNVPVKVGVIISFFGVSFLLKYAIDNSILNIPISFRYIGVAVFSAVLMGLGWRMRESNRVYALSLQGGGIGVLFLVVFAAFRLHGLLPATVAFALFVLLTAAAGYLAVRQESRALAILGTTGGFLAPLLASTGSGNHVALFSYYLVLNCAVLGVAWVRAWRELNIIGFVFTFGVGTLWGAQYYVPELAVSTIPFLALNFLFYTSIAILFAFRSRPELRGIVDATLVFGTPTIAFVLLTQVLEHTEYGLAISAAMVAGVYAGLAVWLHRLGDDRFTLLKKSFVALGVAFGTIAVPLALDDRWTAIAWAIEGTLLVWIGVRQSGSLAKISGSLLAISSGVEFLRSGWIDDLGIPVLNGNFIGAALIGCTSLYSAWLLLDDERDRAWQKLTSLVLLVWGLLWWFGSGFTEISDRASYSSEVMIGVVYYGASFLALLYAANRLRWLALWQITLAVLPFVGAAGLLANGWRDGLGLPVLNGNVLGGVLIAWMGLYSARKLATDERADASLAKISYALLGLGLMFWFGTGTLEIYDRVPEKNALHALLMFGAVSFAGIAYAGRHFDWIGYRRISLAFLPALAVVAVVYLTDYQHFLSGLGWIAWLAALVAHVWILRVAEDVEKIEAWHGFGALFFVGIVSYEAFWQVGRFLDNETWAYMASIVVLGGSAFLVLRAAGGRHWPFAMQRDAYFQSSVAMAVISAFIVFGICVDSSGSPAPLPYIPILNPFGLLSAGVLALLWNARRVVIDRGYFGMDRIARESLLAWAGLAFAFATLALLRGVHHIAGVPWATEAMFDSTTAQTSLTIFWAALGLAGMLLGTQRANRGIWMIGVGLMTVVVLKLMAVDLANTGTFARIVSFLGVGSMLLVVGYFSPAPPGSENLDGD
ncbi:MAG: DUF2339 domain-containing protein [Woeseiaceae bacterium]|nr:DUF2339 domain-containing protein [Woeseiaceae bacterium]